MVPVVGEEVGVAGAGDGLVGGHHEALVRVQHAGEPVEGHVLTAPVVLLAPPRHRHPAVVAGLADRDQPGRLVADVTGPVGVHEVLRGRGEGRDGLAELVPVAGPVQRQDGVGGPRRCQRGPGQRDGVLLRLVAGGHDGPRHGREVGDVADHLVGVGDDRAVHGRPDRQPDVVAAVDPDRLGTGPELELLPRVPVGVAADPLDEEVGDVGPEVGEAPRDVGVVADDHAGDTRRRRTRPRRRDSPARRCGSGGPPAARRRGARSRGGGRWRAAARRWWCAHRRPPRSCCRCRRRGRATPASGRCPDRAGSARRTRPRRGRSARRRRRARHRSRVASGCGCRPSWRPARRRRRRPCPG